MIIVNFKIISEINNKSNNKSEGKIEGERKRKPFLTS